jgi:tRNA-2-methylthio-N6-dimethylallyladenosine synthase
MKRFHVTTFGCQMNEHDSERMKGMLESLGYVSAPARDGRGPHPLHHLLHPREGRDRFVAHSTGGRAQAPRPSGDRRRAGCWAQSVKDQVLRQFRS